MPYAKLSQATLYYTVDGPQDAPALVLSNSLGTNADMWAPQLPELARHFRVLRYDTRGHGLSSVPAGEYRFEQLAEDVRELMDHVGIQRAHLCGLSMGGPTVMMLALRHPERVDRLVLSNTAARIGTVESWNARIEAVGREGLDSMAPGIIERWLTPAYRAAQPGPTQMLTDMLRRTPVAGYQANCAALRENDLRPQVGVIRAPTLVIGGTHDAATTAQQGRELAEAIPGARYVEFDAAHIANWEHPQAYGQAVVAFLKG